MRRAVLTLSATAAGLVALLSYKTHVPGAAPVAEPSTPAALSSGAPSAAATSPGAATSAAASGAPASKPSSKASAAAAPSAAGSSAAAAGTAPAKAPPTTAPPKPSGTFSGPDVSSGYGPVQVVLTVANGKITAANDAQQPGDSISANAVPQLNSEVVQAQSANIQAVSGATYTSQGYIQSLQQAVAKAGL